jgi:AMMECR1 domain-containing protein
MNLAGPPSSSAAPASDPSLDAYRAFARSPQAERLLVVARDAMCHYWGEGKQRGNASWDVIEILWPDAPHGVYVSLSDGRATRACVGSATPYRGGLVETVRALAVRSLHADRRHPPIRREELAHLRVIITFAGSPEMIADPMEVALGREGLLVSSGTASVAFLPGEARTVRWALQEARRIGVLQGPTGSATYARFPVVVLTEAATPDEAVAPTGTTSPSRTTRSSPGEESDDSP